MNAKLKFLMAGSVLLTMPLQQAKAADLLDLATAKEIVAKAAAATPPWDGPTTGPKAQEGKFVVYVSADQRNGGPRGVGEGITEATSKLGWKLRIIDGGGSISGVTAALAQAIALKPDVIVGGNVDVVEQRVGLDKAKAAGIKVLGWHSTTKPGADPSLPLVTNVSTDPLNVARVSAALVVADSGGKANVIVFTDSAYKISVLKSDAMADNIKACPGCSVLQVVDTPLADVANRIPQMTTALLQKYGDKWNYSLGINDGFYDFMPSALASARKKGTDHPLNISGGDGSQAAFERIRQGQYQMATVAEPLHLQGWQLIDEANRALSGEPPSGYVTSAHLVVNSNIGSDGGPKNIYDPANGYREAYMQIWGVK